MHQLTLMLASAPELRFARKTVTSLSLSIALPDHSFLNTLGKSAFGTHQVPKLKVLGNEEVKDQSCYFVRKLVFALFLWGDVRTIWD